jgi:hypothetical protein
VRGVPVVQLHCGLQAAFGKPHVGLEFLHGLAHPGGLPTQLRGGGGGDDAVGVGRFVEHQERLIVVAQQNMLGDPTGIGVLLHKPLPACVNEDAAGH